MTAAIVGAFILYHFNADLGWWGALVVFTGLELHWREHFRKSVIERLERIYDYLTDHD